MEYGHVLGSWTAHDDTVSCLEIDGDLLVTASHDGAVKCWRLASLPFLPIYPCPTFLFQLRIPNSIMSLHHLAPSFRCLSHLQIQEKGMKY